MKDSENAADFSPVSNEARIAKKSETSPPAVPPPKSAGPIPTDTAKKPTAEEQMALYEKELKDNDWGHQPC